MPANKPHPAFTVAAELSLFFIFKYHYCEPAPQGGSQVKGKNQTPR
jgi:hypothetical protein